MRKVALTLALCAAIGCASKISSPVNVEAMTHYPLFFEQSRLDCHYQTNRVSAFLFSNVYKSWAKFSYTDGSGVTRLIEIKLFELKNRGVQDHATVDDLAKETHAKYEAMFDDERPAMLYLSKEKLEENTEIYLRYDYVLAEHVTRVLGPKDWRVLKVL